MERAHQRVHSALVKGMPLTPALLSALPPRAINAYRAYSPRDLCAPLRERFGDHLPGDEGLLHSPEYHAEIERIRDDTPPVDCWGERGDVVLWHHRLAHAAGANMTNKPRRAFAMLLMPRGARYNGQPAALPACACLARHGHGERPA